MDAGTWADLYRSVKKPQPLPVLAGFNANIDQIIPVTPAVMEALHRQTGPGFGGLVRRLDRSMRYCAADEMVVRSPEIYDAFCRFFSSMGSSVLGGQAGIAAVHLHRLGLGPVTCAVPGAGTRTRTMLENAGITPCTFEPEPGKHPDFVHFVLEHTPGLVSPAPGVVPRSNRFIISLPHDRSTVIIPEKTEDVFLAQIASCRRAFLSGYQYLRTKTEFAAAARQLMWIRGVNSGMRTHIECVSGISPRILSLGIDHIFPHADSIGLNEQELAMVTRVLEAQGHPVPAKPLSSPVGLVRKALALSRATGVPRLHLHTFGYYVLIRKTGAGQPGSSRNALLFAAREAANAAGGDRGVFSPDGLLAYAAVRRAFGPEESPGIFCTGDRIVIIVPACISQPARKTAGLGDIISSTAFVADPF